MSTALTGSRISLRPIAADDLLAIEAWWSEAHAAVQGARDPDTEEWGSLRMESQLLNDPRALVIFLLDAAEPIGLLRRVIPYKDWLEFTFLALAKGHRGWGYGSEAVHLIEESERARRFAADVYTENGLGLYFWLRMGYRPGRPSWKTREAGDRVTMIREREE